MWALQVNGKLRNAIEVQNNIDQSGAEAAAKADPSVAKFLEGKSVKKVIFVPGRILNFIVPGK